MREFKGDINLSSFSEWSISSAKLKADSDGYIECPYCNGSGEVKVEVELPSGRYAGVYDECTDCDDGFIRIDEIKDDDLEMIASKSDYRMNCAESVRLLSAATKTNFFLNLCKAKEMHK